MITPVTYETTMTISSSWDAVRRVPNWEVAFGSKIIQS